MEAINNGDQVLIHKYLSGDQTALEALIIRHKQKIFSYILTVVKDRSIADDIFQDTFIKIINTLQMGGYNEEGKFIQWSMRIAHNLIIDHFRKSKRIPLVESKEEFDVFSLIRDYDKSIEDKIVTEQIHGDIKKIIELLPDEQKEVLIMRYYYMMSFKDIAEQNDISINTALGRMRYALINLRKIIEKNEMVLTA